jgi:hypothetical protein
MREQTGIITFSVSCTDPLVAMAFRSAFIILLSCGSLPHSSRRYRVTSFSTCFPGAVRHACLLELPTVLPPGYPILLVSAIVIRKVAAKISRIDAV